MKTIQTEGQCGLKMIIAERRDKHSQDVSRLIETWYYEDSFDIPSFLFSVLLPEIHSLKLLEALILLSILGFQLK